MQFNKPPEWGSRFQFPENFHVEYDAMSGKIENQIAVVMAEKYDNFVVTQIAMEARASGVSDLTVLNKAAILGAIKKQMPQKPIGTYTDYKCPVCGRRVRSGKGSSSRQRDNFCQRCGQKLDWED